MSDYKVKFAVWGAIPNGDAKKDEAGDISEMLQAILNSRGSVVKFTTDNFHDTAKGHEKHFAGIVARDGADHYFACAEGQSIDFSSGGNPT